MQLHLPELDSKAVHWGTVERKAVDASYGLPTIVAVKSRLEHQIPVIEITSMPSKRPKYQNEHEKEVWRTPE